MARGSPEEVRVGALAPFVVSIPSWQFVAVGLGLVSSFVHICALTRASYSLRTLIGLAGLSLFLASTTATELASQDDSGVLQLLWCLCTSILTDNYDPNTDAHPWKRVMWMLSTWLQLGLMYRRTSVGSSTTQRLLFRAVVVLKGMKLHFLHGWHCSSWDETKDDSKTQCEHLTAVATWLEVDWSPHLETVEVTTTDERAFWWRSLLEGKPRRATAEGSTRGRDCCDLMVKFKGTPSSVVPAMAFSIKRQFKAKLGSMATLSPHYSYLAITEVALALTVIAFMAWEWKTRAENRTLPAGLCLSVWCLELVYHAVTCNRVFHLAEEVLQQSSEHCRSRKLALGPWEARLQPCLVITDLILGSVAEAVVTLLASIGKGAKLWAKLSSIDIVKSVLAMVRYFFAVCVVMPMGLLESGGKKLHALWNRMFKQHNLGHVDRQLQNCYGNLQNLQELMKRHPDEMSMVERVMYPSITGGASAPTSAAPVTNYSLTALEAVFFSQLLGQASAPNLVNKIEEDLQSLLRVWQWTSKAFKDGMIDSSWLSPNISRAMWHADTFEQADIWRTTLKDLRQVLDGEINPSAQPSSNPEDVAKASDEWMASLEAAKQAAMRMIERLDPESQLRTRKAEVAMRAGLFAVVAFCKNWGGPETVAVPGPLKHECLMASLLQKWDFQAIQEQEQAPP